MAQSPGQPPSREDVEKIINEVDIDGDGSINFNGKFAEHAKVKIETSNHENHSYRCDEIGFVTV